MEKLCTVDGCSNKHRAREMCRKHYESWRLANPDKVVHGLGKWDNPDGTRMTCLSRDCEDPIRTQGMCSYHYAHMWYRASPRGQEKKSRNRAVKRMSTKPLCTFEGCGEPEFNPGLCGTHYYQKRRGEELRPSRHKVPCQFPECSELYLYDIRGARVFCRKHQGLKAKYNFSNGSLIEMFTDSKCANPGCAETENLHVDHDHTCCPNGKFPVSTTVSCGRCVRGLLCRGCNHALGNMQEDPRRIEGLLRYLGS